VLLVGNHLKGLNMEIVFVPRAQAGYNPSPPRLGYDVDPAARTELIHHHTVTVDNDITRNTWETRPEVLIKAAYLQTVRPDLGLDVPYNLVAFYMVDDTVLLVEGRGMYLTGAHTKNHNTAGIGVGWAGDFHNHPAPRLLADAVTAVEQWVVDYDPTAFVNLPGGPVSGHRDWKATACPGAHLYPLIAAILPQPTQGDNMAITDAEAKTLHDMHEALVARGSNGGAIGFAVDLIRQFRGHTVAGLEESAEIVDVEARLSDMIAEVIAGMPRLDVDVVTKAVTAELVRRITSQ
jgi:hypothetical protein